MVANRIQQQIKDYTPSQVRFISGMWGKFIARSQCHVGMIAHACNPNTPKVEAEESLLSLKSAWTIQEVLC